jgi:hypothetical protein
MVAWLAEPEGYCSFVGRMHPQATTATRTWVVATFSNVPNILAVLSGMSSRLSRQAIWGSPVKKGFGQNPTAPVSEARMRCR